MTRFFAALSLCLALILGAQGPAGAAPPATVTSSASASDAARYPTCDGACPTSGKQHYRRYKRGKMGSSTNATFTKAARRATIRQLRNKGVMTGGSMSARESEAAAAQSRYTGTRYATWKAWLHDFNAGGECMGWVLSYVDKTTLPECQSDPQKIKQGKVLIACSGFALLAVLFRGKGNKAAAAVGLPLSSCAWGKITDAW